MTRMLQIVVATVFVLLGGTGPVHADAIDGSWCSPSGKQVTISGPDVTTPGGQRITGAYTRHTMTFRIPDGEHDAGLTLHMEQQSEELVHVTRQSEVQTEPGPHENWTRCAAVS